MKIKLLATIAAGALALHAGAASAASLIGSYWVGGGIYWLTGYPQTAYSPLDAAVLLFGPGSYAISISNTVVTHTAWTDGYGTGEHLKTNWDTGLPGTAVTETFKPRPTYDDFGAYSAYICDRECLIGGTPTGPRASINYVFSATPEPASWALMVAGFGLVGVAVRRRAVVAA